MENQENNASKQSFDGIVEEEDPRYYHLFLSRLTNIKMALMIFVIAIFISIMWDQFGSDSDILRSIDDEQSKNWVEDTPVRGTIYSDSHDALAIDVLKYSLRFDPFAQGLNDTVKGSGQTIFDKYYVEFATALSEVLKDKSPQEYAKYLKTLHDASLRKQKVNRNSPLTSRLITPEELSYLKKHSVLFGKYDKNKNGIKIEPKNKREYPEGNIAGRTIGIHSSSAATSTGLERCLDYRLAGRKGTHESKQFSKGLWIVQSNQNNVESQDGWDVVTTINVDLQRFVQNDLARQIRVNDADWGTAIVLDVPTGDIKAIANARFDHTKDTVYLEKPDSSDFYAIHERIEPGSTFKTVVFTALIDLKHLSLSEMYNTGSGTRFFPRGKITVVDDHHVGEVTFKQVLEQSSNVGMAMAAERHCSSTKGDMQALADKIKSFGILRTLNDLDIPSNVTPTMRSPKDRNWSYSDFITQSFGYAVDLTPMHIAMFYNALANNGTMVKPRFVTSYEDNRTHQTIATKNVEVINEKICEPETLSKVRQALEGVVQNGTAKRTMAGCKFQYAGKTGTAKLSQYGKGYNKNSASVPYLGTFVAYFPADKPRYTVLVSYKTMHTKGSPKPWSGAMLSAPVVKNIADYIYDKEHKTAPVNVSNSYVVSKPSKMSAPIGNKETLKNLGANLGVSMPGVISSDSDFVGIDSVGIKNGSNIPDSSGYVNVVGYCLSDALDVLHANGIKAIVEGEGNVYKQTFEIKNGQQIVTLHLK